MKRWRSALKLLALLAGGLTHAAAAAPPHQAGPMAYALESTWSSRDPSFLVTPLEWPAEHRSGGIGLDLRDGRLYATDRTAGTVRAYDATGRLEATLAGPGSAPGRLDAPRDVAVLPDGHLAVSDTGNHRVQVLAPDGTFVTSWPVADPQGLVYVSDPGAPGLYVASRADGAILGFSTGGQAIERLDLPPGASAEELAFLEAPSVNDGGQLRRLARLGVAATGIGTVLDLFARQPRPVMELPGVAAVAARWPPESGPQRVGAPLEAWQAFAGAPGVGVVPVVGAPPEMVAAVPFVETTDLEFGPDGTLYAAVEPGGLVSLGQASALVPWLTGLGKLAGPQRIAAGDEILIGDRWPRVQRWAPDGTPLATMPLRLVDAGTVRAQDVAAAGAHRYALASDGVVRTLGDDAVTGSWDPGARGWGAPVAMDAHGDAVAVLDLARQTVDVLSPALEPVATFRASAPGTFRFVADIALSAERVFLADTEASQIRVLRGDGTEELAIPVPRRLMRVAAHPDGSVLALTEIGWVLAFAPDGTARGAWPVGGTADRPTDLAVDGDGRLYVSDANDAVRVYRRADDTPVPPLPPPSDGCRLVRDKTAEPPAIDLGDAVTVTLTVAGTCTAEARAADVVLAIDVSGSMGNAGKHVAAKNAAIAFVAQLDPDTSRVAVVAFATEARLVQPLTADRGAAIAAIGGLPIGGGTNLPAALDVARAELTGATRPDAAHAIVLLTDGRSTAPGNLDAAIAALAASGLDVYTVGLGLDADRATLARIASDPTHAFFSPTIDELAALYAEIGRRIWQPDPVASIELVDIVPPNMTYLPGSAAPAEPDVAPGGRRLAWPRGRLTPSGGVRVTYRLRPEQTGTWPTNDAAHADVVDGLGQANRLVFPVPVVRVRGRGPIYLPLGLAEDCAPTQRPNAIVLAMDASVSMEDRVASGGTKREAARDAARAFVELIDLRRDRVAVVAFNTAAKLVQPLTRDRAALHDALGQVHTAPGTGIAGAVDRARDELLGDRRAPDDHPVIVLLTDGRANPESPEEGVRRAAAARADGITIFAIGLGDDVDAAALAEIAGAPERFFAAPDGADLAEVYRGIARQLPCPPSSFWGRR